MSWTRSSFLSLALALGSGLPALASDYADVASLLEAVRSGQQKTNRRVTLTRAVVTTAPVAWGYDGVKPYTTWFYVNDPGRDGDGILISIPNYYAGTNPFDEDDDNPWEADIALPALARGQVISLSARLERRDDDSGGFALTRADLDDVELIPDTDPDASGSGSLRAELKVTGQVTLPAPAAPSGVSLAEGSLRAGETVVVSGRDLSDRARVTLDGKRLTVTDRRPGLLLASLPSDAAPGPHALRVENPSGKSAPIALTVLAPPAPSAPRLTAAVRAGKVLSLRGSDLSGAGLEVYLGSTRLTRLFAAGAGQILAEVPAGASGDARVVVAGQSSNALTPTSPQPTTGFTGAVPGH